MVDRKISYDGLRKAPLKSSSSLLIASSTHFGVDGTSIPGQRKLQLPVKSNQAAIPSTLARPTAPSVTLLIQSIGPKRVAAQVASASSQSAQPTPAACPSPTLEPVTAPALGPSTTLNAAFQEGRRISLSGLDPHLKLGALVDTAEASNARGDQPGWAERVVPALGRWPSPARPADSHLQLV
jgi:hypothetical protein